MRSTKTTASFRCDRELLNRMVEAGRKHGLSLSEWMRRTLEEAVAVQLPPSVIKGWKQAVLEEGEVGAFYAGNAAKLPENLIGEAVEAVSEQGGAWTGVIDKVCFRTDRIAIVKVKPNIHRQPAAERLKSQLPDAAGRSAGQPAAR